MAAGLFASHRPSEISQLATSEVVMIEEESTINFRAMREKNDQLGVGQLAFLASIPAWGECLSRVGGFRAGMVPWLVKGK